MKSSTFSTIVIAVFVLSTAFSAEAQSMRTWVTGIGDDANPCSQTAPCKTFAVALTRTAAGGEIDCLGPGGFGAVIITKSVTIDCSGTFGSIQVTTGNAISITAPAVVRLRGLSLTGVGAGQNGISITAAAKVFVEEMVIDAFLGSGILLQNPLGPASLFVDNCTIRNNTGFGINILPTSTLKPTNTQGTISNTRIWNNGNSGIVSQTSDFAVTNCIIGGNATGITTSLAGTVKISGNTISENGTGLSAQSGSFIISYQNNAIFGNTTNGSSTSTQGLN